MSVAFAVMSYLHRIRRGFTSIETIVGVAIFVIIALGIYQSYLAITSIIRVARFKVVATALANEQFEIIRNLPYANVGIVSGLPAGSIPHAQTLIRDGKSFNVESFIRNIDDPFDGVLGGIPNDISPADYKLAQITISCVSCPGFQPLNFTTNVMPRSLETASANGALFIRVFDAAGQPISGASVHIENNQGTTTLIIDDTTNTAGLLQIIDAPPGPEAYEITITKVGYSTDRTYPAGAMGNPNPTKRHATVSVQQVTQVSFSIDLTSTLDVSSVTTACAAVPSIDVTLKGSKLIGTGPDVFKYDTAHVTSASGGDTITGLEWDTYDMTLTDAAYDIAGTIPLLPVVLNPNSIQDFKLVVALKNPRSLLVTVKDSSTQLALSTASVRLQDGGSYDTTLITGRGFLTQTDWSGGSGQSNFTDATKYLNSDGNISIDTPAEDVTLLNVFGLYQPSGELTSSAFDTGSVSAFHQILWSPQSQPPATGADSVKFQVATNNDNSTWNFLGPDGTASTFYTLSNQNIHGIHGGDRYFRYKMYLSTASTTWTPNVADVSFNFTSSCVPPGQVLFTGLAVGSYTAVVSATGYQNATSTISVSSGWQQDTITLSP